MSGCHGVIECYKDSLARQRDARRAGDRAARELLALFGTEQKAVPTLRAKRIHVRLEVDSSLVVSWSLGQSIRAVRIKAGLTQDALAELTGIARPNVVRIESGRHAPSLTTLQKIAKALRVDLSTLTRMPTPDDDEDTMLAEAGFEDFRRRLEEEDQK